MLGKNILALRMEKGVTQEQLAAAVGVSAPAVSKWESGKSLPDILLLKPIARFFGVSLDQLMSFNEHMPSENVNAAIKACTLKFAEEGFEAGLTLVKQFYADFQDDKAFLFRLGGALYACAAFAKSDDEVKECFKFQQVILESAANTSDEKLSNQSRFLLACTLMSNDQIAESRKLIESLVEASTEVAQAENLLPTLLLREEKYQEAEKLSQQLLLKNIGNVVNGFTTMVHAAIKQEKLIKAYVYVNALETLLLQYDLQPLYHSAFASALMLYAKEAQDEEALMKGVKLFAEGLLKEEKGPYSKSTLFDLTEAEMGLDEPVRVAMGKAYLNELNTDEGYAVLREKPMYKEIIQKLSAMQ